MFRMTCALCNTKYIDKIKIDQPLLISFSSNVKLSSYLENFVTSDFVIMGLSQNFKIVYLPQELDLCQIYIRVPTCVIEIKCDI